MGILTCVPLFLMISGFGKYQCNRVNYIGVLSVRDYTGGSAEVKTRVKGKCVA
jgi:hypothetical protein